jgi:acyl-CoA synthetase (NDP forming)
MMVVTDSGGEAQLIGDHARAVGLDLPAPSAAMKARLQERWPNFAFIGNPVDPWGVDPDFHVLYAEIVDAMAAEDVDVIGVAIDKVTTWMGGNEIDLGASAAGALIRAAEASGRFGAFFTLHGMGPAHPDVRLALREAGIPLMHGLRPAMVALRRAWYWQWWRERTLGERPASPPRPPVDEPGPVLSERSSREILAAYGIPLAAGSEASTVDEAIAAALGLGFPVVMKADVPGVAHKARAGLVRTAVASEEAVREAFDALTERAAANGTPARGVLVQETARGVELICGMRRDPLFGPVVLVGAGGSLTEVLQDVACRVAPLSREDLEEMVDECAAGRLLQATGADASSLRDTLAALSDLACNQSDIAEVDVNPLFVDDDGSVRAADALVVLGKDT